MGVNAEAGGRVEMFRAGRQTGEEGVEDWAAVGEVRGLVDGRMDEVSVGEDWPADWTEEEEEDTKEGGRVEEGCARDGLIAGGVDEAMTRGWWSGDSWLGEVISVNCVSSVLFGTLLYEIRQRTRLKYCYTGSCGHSPCMVLLYVYLSSTSTVMVSCFSPWISTFCDLKAHRKMQRVISAGEFVFDRILSLWRHHWIFMILLSPGQTRGMHLSPVAWVLWCIEGGGW